MADNRAQEDQITAKLLILSNQQVKALQDATFLGWREGELEAYQKRGDPRFPFTPTAKRTRCKGPHAS